MNVMPNFQRASADEVKALAVFPTATIHEAAGRRGAMVTAIKPIYPGMAVAGPALTVRSRPGDNLAIHAAVLHGKPGDVLVVDHGGFLEAGPFGDVLATACEEAGIRGLVIDGCVRDGLALKEMGFPVFARGLNMKGPHKDDPGEIGVPVICGGVLVAPGDLVVGDDDGVVIIPRGEIADTLAASRVREDKEDSMKADLRKGANTVDLLKLRSLLERRHG